MRRVFGITGWKNAGKTTLTVRLVEHLTAQGFSVSTIKHAHHIADIDHEGTDSYKHRQAGAREVMLATPVRFALMRELQPGETEPSLDELLDRMGAADLVLVEGYKRETIPKIMILREGDTESEALEKIPEIAAFVHEKPEFSPDSGRPVFGINDIPAIAAFILAQLGLTHGDVAS